MVKLPLSVTRGIDTGNQMLSPFDKPGPLTRFRSRSRNETSLTGTDDTTPHRPHIGSTDSNSSASSSGTTFSSRSDASADNQGCGGTPITPPSDYSNDIKELEVPSYAANPRRSLFSSRGSSGEISSGSNRLGEAPRHSEPQLAGGGGGGRSTRPAVTKGLGFVGLNDVSPTVRKVRTNNLKKQADAAKVAYGSDEDDEVEEDSDVEEDDEAKCMSGTSEALRVLGSDSDGNGTESGRGPEGINKAVQRPEEAYEADEKVSSDASHGTQPEQQHQTFFDVVDSFSSSREDGISDLPSSETAVLPGEVEEQSDVATTRTTRCPTPTLIPDDTTESTLEDGSDATASADVDRHYGLNEEPRSTSIETVNPAQNGESGRPPNVKDTATLKEARAKELAAKREALRKEREEKAAAKEEEKRTKTEAKKQATANETTVNIATSTMAATAQSQSPGKISSAKPQGANLDCIPVFSNFHDEEHSTSAIHDEMLEILKHKERTKPNAETESPGDGYVYIYRSPLCHGLVKIGITKETPHARISQWEKDCKLEITRLEDHKSHRFLHVRLVETLIQNELYNERRKYACRQCRAAKKKPVQEDKKTVDHGEWYEISEERALAIVQKWRYWLVTNRPYNSNGVLRPSWNEKREELLKETALVDSGKWVEAWIQPLTSQETRLYFWRHTIKTINDMCTKIQTLLKLVVGLLTPLQLIGEKAIELLLPFFMSVVCVLIPAYFILSYVNAAWAFLFVVFGFFFAIFLHSWMAF